MWTTYWHDKWGRMSSAQQGSVPFALVICPTSKKEPSKKAQGSPGPTLRRTCATTRWSLAPLNSLGNSVSLDPGPRTESPQPVSSVERRWSYGLNAAKGSRQTGHVPSEDVVAPEAKSPGPATGDVYVEEIALCGSLVVVAWGPDHPCWCRLQKRKEDPGTERCLPQWQQTDTDTELSLLWCREREERA